MQKVIEFKELCEVAQKDRYVRSPPDDSKTGKDLLDVKSRLSGYLAGLGVVQV